MITNKAAGGVVSDRSVVRFLDVAKGPSGEEFRRTKGIERRYVRQLVQVAKQVGAFINTFGNPLEDPLLLGRMQIVLERYSQTIGPWAEQYAGRIIGEVNQNNERAWLDRSRKMSEALRAEIRTAPTGQVMRQLLAEQVGLIKSLPTEAGQRVHRLTMEGIGQGTRAREVAKMIAASGEVTASRATLIARTEIGRTATALTQARATSIGSDGYLWRTSEDDRVRPSHAAMDGRFVAWSDPPTLDNLTGHAGALPNCRCYAEPVIPGI